jgi:hypothetical protein
MTERYKTICYAKNSPIGQLEAVRKEYKFLAELVGRKLRVRFRGPRYDGMRLFTLKRHAHSFSVYFV